MVPRKKIVSIDINWDKNKIIEFITEEGYSRLPVFDKNIDNIIGVIYAKDIINLLLHQNIIIIRDLIRLPYFVSEDDKIKTVLNELKKKRMHLAIVQDDFGGTAGLVTLEDIIEEIVGEIQDEYDEELPLVEIRNDNQYYVVASASIDDANEYLPNALPEDENYETVGGMVIYNIGYIPEEGEVIELNGYSCKIVKRGERQLELIALTALQQ